MNGSDGTDGLTYGGRSRKRRKAHWDRYFSLLGQHSAYNKHPEVQSNSSTTQSYSNEIKKEAIYGSANYSIICDSSNGPISDFIVFYDTKNGNGRSIHSFFIYLDI